MLENNSENALFVLATLNEGQTKCRMEREETLPDYCGDLLKIIRTDIKPKVESKSVYEKDGSIFCDLRGKAVFSVLYLSSSGDTGSVSYTLDFDNLFKAVPDKKNFFDTSMIYAAISLFCENVSARIVSARKLLLRGDVNISLQMKANKLLSYQNPDDCATLEKITFGAKAVRLGNVGEKNFLIKEDIVLPDEYPEIAKILNCDLSIICDSARCLDGKVIFNATAVLTCLYQSTKDSSLISFTQPIEHSQIMELDGVDSLSSASVSLLPTLLRAGSDYNDRGESRLISFELEYNADVFTMKNCEYQLISDAFSPTNNISASKKERDFEELCACVPAFFEENAKIPLKAREAVRVENIKGVADFRDSYIEDGKVKITVKLYFKLLCIREDESCEALEENTDFTLTLDPGCDLSDYSSLRIELDGGVKSVSGSVSEGNIDLFASFAVCARIFGLCKGVYIEKAEILNKRERSLDHSPVILYYPSEGESLWDISKRYSVPTAKLMAANSLESDDISEVRILKIEDYIL